MGKVTVNGAPLEQFIGAEIGQEIQQHRESEVREVKWSRPLVSRQHRNHSKERTSTGAVVYRAGQRETHVLIAGIEFPWHAKAPFVRSGESVLGAIEYDKNVGVVKCHECGEWKSAVGRHAWTAHGLTSKGYKKKHGLGYRTHLTSPEFGLYQRSKSGTKNLRPGRPELISKTHRENKTENAKARYLEGKGFSHSPETANLRGKCKAQLTSEIQKLAASLGRVPTAVELSGHRLYPQTIASVFGEPVKNVFLSLGLVPRGRGKWMTRKDARRVS